MTADEPTPQNPAPENPAPENPTSAPERPSAADAGDTKRAWLRRIERSGWWHRVRQWRLPGHLGRARTSTVLIAVAFAATAVLHGELNPELPAQQRPAPARTESPTPTPPPAANTTTRPPTSTPPTTTPTPSGSATGTGTAASTTPTTEPLIVLPPGLVPSGVELPPGVAVETTEQPSGTVTPTPATSTP
ncbi:hypothetical protein ACFWQG_07770 [Rhodococcus sp. NPDC058532]|uniref:hypothetical protein n=1 Tax=Rhodococcus sp. NPDC058532 TaxID=3346540 RepID=UPI003650862C